MTKYIDAGYWELGIAYASKREKAMMQPLLNLHTALMEEGMNNPLQLLDTWEILLFILGERAGECPPEISPSALYKMWVIATGGALSPLRVAAIRAYRVNDRALAIEAIWRDFHSRLNRGVYPR